MRERVARWAFLTIGGLCTAAGVVLAILAIHQATEISAYHHARPCGPSAAASAECLRTVDGTVAAVTEFPGGPRISPNYSLDVRTASTTLHLKFSSDSPLLGYAVDGNAAVVTMWRRVPVSVMTNGYTEFTTAVPETSFVRELGNSEETGGIGVLCLIIVAIRRNRRGSQPSPMMRPTASAGVLALMTASIVLAIAGYGLRGKPSRLAPDQTVAGVMLVIVVGLSAWLGVRAKRRLGDFGTQLARSQALATNAQFQNTAPPWPAARTPLRARLRAANRARLLGTLATVWLTPALTVGVLFGVFLTSHDGPQARAFRHAPACVGETNLATCVGDFTATINGVRTPANGRNSADISYVTSDAAINQWGTFDGNSSVLARLAAADEEASTPLRIRVWRGWIVGAELGGSWHWTEGNPPGEAIPAIFMSISFALLLLVVRLRIHRRARSGTSRQQLVAEDLGQVLGAAASIVLLASGFWAGAIMAVAVLVWLGLSARQPGRGKRAAVTAEHAI